MLKPSFNEAIEIKKPASESRLFAAMTTANCRLEVID
jgi:hypothetical protein